VTGIAVWGYRVSLRRGRSRRGPAVALLLLVIGAVAIVTGGAAVATTPLLGSITVIKHTVGGDGTFGFTGDFGSFDITTAGGTESQTFAGIEPGTYDIFESLPSGWSLDSFECDGVFVAGPGANGVSVTVGAGEDVTCTFSNSVIAAPATITVVKNAVGGDAVFDFGSSFGGFQISTSGGTGSYAQEVTATEHKIQELGLPSGWTVDGVTCDADFVLGPGANEVSVTVGECADVTCAFTNRAVGGSITITKDVTGGLGTFAFTGSLGDFELVVDNDVGAASRTFSGLAAGTYDVIEVLPTGWSLDGIACDDGSPTDPATATANVLLDEGEDIFCTFLNSTTIEPPITAAAAPPPATACTSVPDGATLVIPDRGGVALVSPAGTEQLELSLPAAPAQAARGPDGTVWV
jgi:hypothetical protein